MRRWFTIAILSLGLPAPALAEADDVTVTTAPTPDCLIEPEKKSNCVHFTGCFGTNGNWFVGTSRGWETGLATLTINTGATCRGDWEYRPRLDMGRIAVACTNGDKFEMSFFARDEFGTAVSGSGVSESGLRVMMFGGPNLPAYLKRREDTGETATITCGPRRLTVDNGDQ